MVQNVAMTGGYVFVVHGRLENLDYDAVLIPTDDDFYVEDRWAPVLGVDPAGSEQVWSARAEARPAEWEVNGGWRRARVGVLRGTPAIWFIDSTNESGGVAGRVRRLEQVLKDMANVGLEPGNGRPRPLVAMNVLGVGKGGSGGEERGDSIKAQLDTCIDAVSQYNLDVVIVTPNRSDYAAVQTYRKDPSRHPGLPSEQDAVKRLVEKARTGSLAVFLGAGVSMSAGLPSWNVLLDDLEQLSGKPKIEKLGVKSPEVV